MEHATQTLMDAEQILKRYGFDSLSSNVVRARLSIASVISAIKATEGEVPTQGAASGPGQTMGERLRERRRELDISSDKLGEMCGWSGVTVRAHENGQNSIPTKKAAAYAAALGVTPEYILFGT